MPKKGDVTLKNLKNLREERGLSQQKLADQFCLSQQSIYKYENGLAEPDFATLKQFANFFHTTIDYLIGYETADGTQETFTITLMPKTFKEAHHLELYQKLSPKTQTQLDNLLETIVEINDDNGTNK